jgi:YgiT-type zinc finger domain-containing protein
MMSLTRPVFKKCPSCGSRRIKRVRGDYCTTARGKPIVVSRVSRHECPACGEVLLDYEAVKRIERRRFAPRKSRRVARPA